MGRRCRYFLCKRAVGTRYAFAGLLHKAVLRTAWLTTHFATQKMFLRNMRWQYDSIDIMPQIRRLSEPGFIGLIGL